jgi:uncharacterized protein YndB with AHSA1/START domain
MSPTTRATKSTARATSARRGTSDSKRPARKPAVKVDGVRRGTGRSRDEWNRLLDAWGAGGRPYREIAEWLKSKHKLTNWWAQKLIVEYEQSRGLREPGVRPGGTFEVGATKTVGVPVDELFAAFTDAGVRRRWLPGASLRKRGSDPGKSVRFDWDDGPSRIAATFARTGAAKSQVAVQHTQLPDLKTADAMKTFWRERLVALKALLER